MSNPALQPMSEENGLSQASKLPSGEKMSALLNVDGLTVAYRHGNTWPKAVRDFSMELMPGQTYGLVGESGSGKTTVAMAIPPGTC